MGNVLLGVVGNVLLVLLGVVGNFLVVSSPRYEHHGVLGAHVVPRGSVRGERANLKGLVLGCIEAKFCK